MAKRWSILSARPSCRNEISLTGARALRMAAETKTNYNLRPRYLQAQEAVRRGKCGL